MYYFRYIGSDVEIELSDIGSLKLEEYDKLCGIERQTYPTMAMNRKKWKYNKNNRTYESKVYSISKHPLPQYATKQSAGLDLRANIDAPITINPRERVLVPTGLHIQLPEGFEARIQPRSGLALKKGITCLNSPGCVDADYRGDVGVILINHGTEPFTVNDGERIAQMIISKYEQAEWEPVSSIEDLEATERGEQGFGHSGIK